MTYTLYIRTKHVKQLTKYQINTKSNTTKYNKTRCASWQSIEI